MKKIIITTCLSFIVLWSIKGQPLTLAISKQNFSKVEKILEKKNFSINAVTFRNETALGIAVKKMSELYTSPILEYYISKSKLPLKYQRKAIEVKVKVSKEDLLGIYELFIEDLIKRGANPNIFPDKQSSPLDYAIAAKMDNIALLLLQNKAALEPSKSYMLTAAEMGSLTVVEQIFEFDKASINERDTLHNQMTPLHIAAQFGHDSIVDFFIKKGLNPREVTTEESNAFAKHTPLHFAAMNGHTAVVKRLLQEDIGVNEVAKSQFTPLLYACAGKRVETIEDTIFYKLMWERKLITPQQLIFEGGNTAIVKLLLEHGAEVNVRDKKGLTPLHYAAMEGNLETVKLLLKQGANPNTISQRGESPTHLATLQQHFEITDAIFSKDAKITPLAETADDNFASAVNYLSEISYHPNKQSKNMELSMHYFEQAAEKYDALFRSTKSEILLNNIGNVLVATTAQLSANYQAKHTGVGYATYSLTNNRSLKELKLYYKDRRTHCLEIVSKCKANTDSTDLKLIESLKREILSYLNNLE